MSRLYRFVNINQKHSLSKDPVERTESHPPSEQYYTILDYDILYYTILCYTIIYYSILYHTIPYYPILYYTILCYTILYYTILYYTMLYYTMLYYTILYYTIQSSRSLCDVADSASDRVPHSRGVRVGCSTPKTYPYTPSI